MPKEHSLIHVKLETYEALESKRNVLESQAQLIKIAQTIKKYRELRLEELDKKAALMKKLKLLKTNITKLEKLLPILKIPKLLKRQESESEMFNGVIDVKRVIPKSDLEAQLEEIQNKLKSLQE